MTAPDLIRPFRSARLLCLCFAILTTQHAFGANGDGYPIKLESAGVRYGFGANDEARYLQQVEIFSNISLPLAWDLDILHVYSRLDLGLGWIGDHSDNALIGSLGPSLQFRRRGLPLQLDFGSGPTYLSKHEWGNVNVSTAFPTRKLQVSCVVLESLNERDDPKLCCR